MANERYITGIILEYAARHNLGNITTIIIAESDYGKTATVGAIMRDVQGAAIVPSATQTELMNWFRDHRHIKLFILDDPSAFFTQIDFNAAITVLKGIQTGILLPPRMNKFDKAIPESLNASVMVLCNPEQYSNIFTHMKTCGFFQRSLPILVTHSDGNRNDIYQRYRKHGYGGNVYPHYDISDTEIKEHEVSQEDKDWILKHFTGERAHSVEIFAKLLGHKRFVEFMPFLTSSSERKPFDEKIIFKPDVVETSDSKQKPKSKKSKKEVK